jgi:tetratricopeptide (TPR) repeat protein
MAIARELDGLPLALATAGAYLDQVPATSFSDYLRHYRESWLKLQQTSPVLESYEDRALYTTWDLSFSHIKKQNVLSAKVLQLWAYFDNQDLWFELLRHSDSKDPEWLQQLTEDELSFNGALRVLCNHGLGELDHSSQERIESRGYSIHGCVHSWTIHILNQEEDYDLARLALKLIGLHIPGTEIDKWWLTQRRLLQHVARCSDLISNDLVAVDGMEWACHELGDLYSAQGKLDEAEKMYARALQGREKALGADHTSTLATVNNLGILYRNQGKLDEAEKMYERALQGKEKALGADHISTLETVNNLGDLYTDQGKLDEAEKMYARALQGREKALGADHTSTLATVNNLGILYRNQGKLDEAEKMYERALQGKEKALGEDHTSTLATVNNLGNLYADQGKLDEAEKMYERALQGYEKALGAQNITTYIPALNTNWGLGSLFQRGGDLAKARTMYSKALVGYEKVMGHDHAHCQTLREILGALDTEPETNALIKTGKDLGHEPDGQASRCIIEDGSSNSKRHRLFRKLGLRKQH